MSNINYFIKYRKYKQKYIIQKNILSGGCFLVNDNFLRLDPTEKEKNIQEYTPGKKSTVIIGNFDNDYEDAYMHFYKSLTKYIYKKYNFEGHNELDPINSWKISLYGCSGKTSERHAFDPDRFNQLQDPNHIEVIRDTITDFEKMGANESFMPAFKPNGIWASELLTGDEQLDFRTWIQNQRDFKEISKPGNCHGFLIIRLNPDQTLTLLTDGDFKKFTDEYAFTEFKSKTKFINWPKVSEKYGAINLPYGAKEQAWFKSWSVASSVIWHRRAVLEYHYITLSELEDDFKKYMYDCPELFD